MSLLVDLYILKSLVRLLEGSALIFQIQNQSISSFRCVRPQIASVLHVFSSVEEPNLLAHPGKCQKTTKNTKEIPKNIKKYYNQKKVQNPPPCLSSPHLLLRRLLLWSEPTIQAGIQAWSCWKQEHTKTKPRPHLHLWDARSDFLHFSLYAFCPKNGWFCFFQPTHPAQVGWKE